MSLFDCARIALRAVLYPLLGCALVTNMAIAQEAMEDTPFIRPVKTQLIEAPTDSAVRRFPASVAANQQAELSFRLAGTLQQMSLNEGDPVAQDDLIAQLDPSDYQVALSQAEANYNEARNNFTRARELLPRGFISRVDFDDLQARFINSEQALEQARLNLSYTELRAPFSGRIARLHVDNFQQISAGQIIVSLNDTGDIELQFDAPETLLTQFQRDRIEAGAGREAPAFVLFSGASQGRRYELTFKEVA